MPIAALPESTSRAIGSTLVLNDAKSIVKELVDNALDARATAINVEISQNTLDVIQVKDNGTGIGVEDRQLLCKRGCTSKIRSLEDLSRLGGSFLGFRGEALASIAELSNVVNVTTRVDGEIVGTALSFGSSRMLSSSSASHPVGTTFRVQNFLHNIPVRKQTALKNSTKTLQSIKALLFSFAFARPKVRFSLKVLKVKSDKGNWTYAPSLKDTLTEVASKIVGQDVALECACRSASSDDDDDGRTDKIWTVEALLASSSASASKIHNTTQYISIDGRPVTSDRGTMKEIVKLYKRYLQAAHESSENSSLSRPFLCLQIKCPPESYDVNVEPAKDEVLFFRPADLLSILEKLFKRAYPVREKSEPCGQPSTRVSQVCSSNMVDCMESPTDEHTNVITKECLPADLSHTLQENDDSLSNIAVSNPFTMAAMTSRLLPKKMDITRTSLSTPFSERSKSPSNGENSANLATRTRAHRTPLDQRTRSPSPIASSDNAIPYQNPGPPLRHRTKVTTRQNAQQDDRARCFGNTNIQRSPDQGTLLQAWLTPITEERRPSAQKGEPQITPSRPPGSDIDDQGKQFLPSMDNLFRTSANSTSGLKWGPGQKSFRPPLKRSSNGQNPAGTTMGLTLTPQDRSGYVPSPPTSDINLVMSPSREPGTALNTTYASNVERSQQMFREPSMSEELPRSSELEDILDFEYRKKAAIAQQRRSAAKFPTRSIYDILKSRAAESSHLTVRESDTFTTPTGDKAASVLDEGDFAARFGDADTISPKKIKSNPHHNRYLAAIKDLSHSHPRNPNPSPGDSSPAPSQDEFSLTSGQERASTLPLPENDPRAYFMRQRQGKGKGKSTLHRTQSSRLPLETIPAGMMTLHLVHTVDGFRDPRDIPTLVEHLTNSDRYIVHGRNPCADLVARPLMSNVWREKILELMKKTYRGKEGEDLGMRIRIDDFDISLPTSRG